MNAYAAAAAGVLAAHVLWLMWVIFGALITRGRPVLAAVHVLSLAWGVAVEVGPWPCPLTALEQVMEEKAGMAPYTQPFLVHYLDKLVYPDVPPDLLTAGAIAVCVLNIWIYIARWRRREVERSEKRFSE